MLKLLYRFSFIWLIFPLISHASAYQQDDISYFISPNIVVKQESSWKFPRIIRFDVTNLGDSTLKLKLKKLYLKDGDEGPFKEDVAIGNDLSKLDLSSSAQYSPHFLIIPPHSTKWVRVKIAPIESTLKGTYHINLNFEMQTKPKNPLLKIKKSEHHSSSMFGLIDQMISIYVNNGSPKKIQPEISCTSNGIGEISLNIKNNSLWNYDPEMQIYSDHKEDLLKVDLTTVLPKTRAVRDIKWETKTPPPYHILWQQSLAGENFSGKFTCKSEH